MRFPSGRFSLLATGKSGAIVEQGDGELQVPAVLQHSVELPAHVSQAALAGGVKSESFFNPVTVAQAGIAAGGFAVSTVTLKAGVWRLNGYGVIQFNGTTQVGVAEVGMRDPAAAAGRFARAVLVNGLSMNFRIDTVIHTIADGWEPYIFTSATVAGDVLNVNLHLFCANLLL